MKIQNLILTGAAMLALTACSSDDMPAIGGGNDGNVTITAKIPEGLQSRAYGDGTQTKKLSYAVYESGSTTPVFASDVANSPSPVKLDETNFTLSLNLITGKSYDFVFWADAETDSPYTFSSSDQNVTVSYANLEANDESRDAFFNSISNLTVSGPINQSIELRRPFAQMNVGTSDIEEAGKAGTVVATVDVKVEGVRNTLNLLTGVASGEETLTFSGAMPAGQAFPVAGYDYVSMNYLLTGAQPEEGNVQTAQRELMDASVKFNFTDGKSNTVEVPNMPVQRNYRTNIYGALLTSPLDLTIVVMPEFYQPDHGYEVVTAKTAADFINALANDNVSVVKVPVDLDLTSATAEDLTLKQFKKIEVSQGATVTLPAQAPLIAEDGFALTGGGTLTNGNVPADQEEIATGNTYRQLIRIMGGDLNINGVTLVNDMDYHRHGNASAGYPYNSAAISYYNDANVTIKNSTITSGEFAICGMGRDVASGKINVTNCYLESTSSNANGTNTWAYTARIFGTEAMFEDCTVVGIQGGLSFDSKELTAVVKSGTYTTKNTHGKMDAFYPIYATNGAKVIIEGGKYAGANEWSTLAEGKSALVAGDNDVNLPNGGITVVGGKFSGLPYIHKPATAIPAPEGYEFVANEDDDKDIYPWTVVKK